MLDRYYVRGVLGGLTSFALAPWTCDSPASMALSDDPSPLRGIFVVLVFGGFGGGGGLFGVGVDFLVNRCEKLEMGFCLEENDAHE